MGSKIVFFAIFVEALSIQSIKERFSNNHTTCTTQYNYPIVPTNISSLEEITHLQMRTRKNEDSPSLYYHCNLGEDEECDSWWRYEGWKKENSIDSDKPMTELITDERWQSFDTIILEDPPTLKFLYIKLMEIKRESFEIPISWKILGDLHFFFCSKEDLHKADCYWIEMLNNFKMFRMNICPPGSIPKSRNYHGPHITNITNVIAHSDLKWDRNAWNGFMLKKSDNNISLSIVLRKLDVEIKMDTIFNFPILKSFNINYIFVRGKGLMKIHDYNYLRTKKAGFYMIGRPFKMTDGLACISLYVSMCRICKMVFIVDGKTLGRISFSDEGTWRHIELRIKNSNSRYEQLFVLVTGNEYVKANNYWAIDYVQLCAAKRFITLPGAHKCEYVKPISGYTVERWLLDFIQNFRSTLAFAANGIPYFRITSKTKVGVDFEFSLDESKIDQPLKFGLHCEDSYDLSQQNTTITLRPTSCGIYYCGHFNLTGTKLFCRIRTYEPVIPKYEGRSNGSNTLSFTNTGTTPNSPTPIGIDFAMEKGETTVRWLKPLITHGPIIKYLITFTEVAHEQNPLNRMIFSTIGNTTSILIKNEWKVCTDYFVQVRGVNSKGPGTAFTKKIDTPAPIPDYLKIVKENQTDTTVDFSIKTFESACQFEEEYNSYLLILLSDNRGKNIDNATRTLESKLNKTLGTFTRIVAEVDLTLLTNDIQFKFTVGSGKIFHSNFLGLHLKNNPLKLDSATINITFICINIFREYLQYFPYEFQVSAVQAHSLEGNSSSSGWHLIQIVLAIFIGILVSLSYYKYRERNKPVALRLMPRPETIPNAYALDNYPVYEEAPEVPSRDTEYLLPNIAPSLPTPALKKKWEVDSKPVRILDFEKYIKCSLGNQELERQFELLPKGLTKPCEFGSLEVNKPKNRTNNILPYDDTRVILWKSDKKEATDYINANFIKGYKKEKGYIATQGPKALTINDFWQMVWQENVKNIVMLVNLEENGVKKVEKYWPSRTQDFEFGKIHVYYKSEEIMADYEIRIFKLVRDGTERQVIQYHFIRWPDLGIPTHFQMLVPFVRRILELTSKYPLVVHCCTGTAATGVLILCDICLKMATGTGIVDVFKVAKELREQRVNMIENILQYKLAHLVIMECLTGIPVVVTCDDNIDTLLTKLTGQDELNLQMRYLEETAWQNRVLESAPTLCQPLVIFPKKNKIPSIVPEEAGVIQLTKYPANDESSAYINAIKVDGYRCPDRYIVTQQPMPETVNDFWRMIVLKNVEIIISLNEIDLEVKKSCNFWPTAENPEISPVDFIILKFSSFDDQEHFTKTVIQVLVHGKEMQLSKVNIFALKGWHPNSPVPSNLQGFLKFLSFSDSISKQFPQSVVTCYDGNRASGVYVATSFLIEKIKVEKCFDVCEAVKIVRRNRLQFISEEIQLAFLYEIAATYIKGFQNYANFSTTTDCGLNIYDYIDL